jgi:hypothetical protein
MFSAPFFRRQSTGDRGAGSTESLNMELAEQP